MYFRESGSPRRNLDKVRDDHERRHGGDYQDRRRDDHGYYEGVYDEDNYGEGYDEREGVVHGGGGGRIQEHHGGAGGVRVGRGVRRGRGGVHDRGDWGSGYDQGVDDGRGGGYSRGRGRVILNHGGRGGGYREGDAGGSGGVFGRGGSGYDESVGGGARGGNGGRGKKPNQGRGGAGRGRGKGGRGTVGVTGAGDAAKKVSDIKSNIGALQAELSQAEKAATEEQEPYLHISELENKLSSEKCRFEEELASEKVKFESLLDEEKKKFEGLLDAEKKKFEVALADEKEKATTKHNTIVQNRVLIEKNRTLALELATLKEAGVAGSGVDVTDLTTALDSARADLEASSTELSEVKEELVGALSRESKLVDDITALTDGDVNGVDVTDLTTALDSARADLEASSTELSEVKEELVGALSRESKLVDDITALTDGDVNEDEPCKECQNSVEQIDMLKVNEAKLHNENEEILKQLEESITDNEGLIKRMKLLKEEIKVLHNKEPGIGDDGDVGGDVSAELEALKRRLGSEEYKFLSASSVAAVVDSMDVATKEHHDNFLAFEMNQVEQLKFLLALSNELVPSIKHILYKNLLSGDTPVQRVCVEMFLAKLCSFDKEQKGLMKEVSVDVQKSNEITPGPKIVHDPSLDKSEIQVFMTKENKGCKVINYGGLVLVAATRSPHVNTKHTAVLDVNNKVLVQRCPIQSCKELFVHGVTDIAPMTVVGPVMHGFLGEERWVCVKHWRTSIADASDDEFCDREALVVDAGEMEKKEGLKILSRKRKYSPKARKQILAEKAAPPPPPLRSKRLAITKAAAGGVSPDMFAESEDIIEDSENV